MSCPKIRLKPSHCMKNTTYLKYPFYPSDHQMSILDHFERHLLWFLPTPKTQTQCDFAKKTRYTSKPNYSLKYIMIS